MARSDLLLEVIKHGLAGDANSVRRATEAICAEERAKQHNVLAGRIDDLLENTRKRDTHSTLINRTVRQGESFFIESDPSKRIDQIILPELVRKSCNDVIEEQERAELLRSYGLEPRNRILLVGPPGNGKTSLAEALANTLMIPLLTVKYESIVGSYLGETATKLSKLIDYAKTRQCVLFFDEFETLGKERGDVHETGEIKRVVSSLLLHIDSLPSHVIVIGATNHEDLLDRAAWRRFQLHLELPTPTRANLEKLYRDFEKSKGIKFGLEPSTLAKKTYGCSFSDAEELALSIYRQHILKLPDKDIKSITNSALKLWQAKRLVKTHVIEEEANK
jgi:SpoVK/Ycf46/Vps4 family AAA+-type ATPase